MTTIELPDQATTHQVEQIQRRWRYVRDARDKLAEHAKALKAGWDETSALKLCAADRKQSTNYGGEYDLDPAFIQVAIAAVTARIETEIARIEEWAKAHRLTLMMRDQ